MNRGCSTADAAGTIVKRKNFCFFKFHKDTMEAGRKVIKEGLEKLHHQLNVSAMDNPFNQVLVMIDNMESDEEDVIDGMVDFVVKYLKMVMVVENGADL